MSKTTTTAATKRIARKRVCVSLPADIAERLLETARAEDRNASSMVAAALRFYFAK